MGRNETAIVTHDQEEAVILATQVVMIFEGALQQFGPPVDFYERSLSERVARLFGGVNFLPGEKQGDVVETELGVFKTVAEPVEAPHENGPVLLTIRPENVRILTDPAPNSFPAHVLSRMYVGTHTRLKIMPVTAVELVETTTELAGTATELAEVPPSKSSPTPLVSTPTRKPKPSTSSFRQRKFGCFPVENC